VAAEAEHVPPLAEERVGVVERPSGRVELVGPLRQPQHAPPEPGEMGVAGTPVAGVEVGGGLG